MKYQYLFIYLPTKENIYKLINMENTDIQKLTKNKKFHVSNYFKVIDTEAKAYILGYIVADGSIEESIRKDRPSKLIRLRFGCVSEDDEILKFIQREIAPTNKLRQYQPLQPNKKMVTIFQICDKELINDLRTLYDIQPRKTYHTTFQFPNIPKEFERHFIRGYIDGDGYIGKKSMSMVCNSPQFAQQIVDRFLEIIPNLKYYIYKENRHGTDYWSLHFCYSQPIRAFIYKYLYEDATVFLTRKKISAFNSVLNAFDKRKASV